MMIRRVGITRGYRTIAEAYYMALPGDVILIDEGIYNEQINMVGNKNVHLVGNTRDPGLGKVRVIPPNEAATRCITFTDFTLQTTIYIEGINFKFPPTSTLEPIAAWRCYETELVFNRCIINATYVHEYVFNFDVDEINSITLNNCRVIWKDDYSYTAPGASHFERSGRDIDYRINKCIFSNSLDNLNTIYFTLPSKNGPNELTTDNTVYSCTNPAGYMGDMTALFDDDIINGPIIHSHAHASGDVITFTTDFGEGNEKSIYYFRTSLYAYARASSVTLYGSSDGINWVKVVGFPYAVLWYSKTLKMEDSYRYYKVDFVATGVFISFYDYSLCTENLDYAPFDYTLKSNISGYGPHYGEYQKYILSDYCLEGTVFDTLSENTVTNTVILDEYNGSSKIELLDDNLSIALDSTYLNQHKAIKASVGKTTGKWYFEFKSYEYYSLTNSRVGFGQSSAANDYACGGADSKSWGMELSTGNFYHGEEVVSQGTAALYSSIVGVALDLDNGKAWFSVNGVWVLDGDPSLGINPIFEFSNMRLFPMISLQNIGFFNAYSDIIFDPFDLNYTIPDGFSYYSEGVKWKINYYNTATNDYLGYVYSDDTGSYKIITTYSGAHFLICEDASTAPSYNDLIYSNLIPKGYV